MKKGEYKEFCETFGINYKYALQKRWKKGKYIVPNYSEMETFLLSNFTPRQVKQMTGTKRTLNALKIKKWRMSRAQRRKDRYIKAPEKLAEIINDSQPPDPEMVDFITDNIDDLI